MNVLKDKKGFTLVELLAVIIVLAVVMAIAVGQLLPAMDGMQESAFDSEVKIVSDAASQAISLIMLNDIQGSYSFDKTKYTVTKDDTSVTTAYCFTLQNLIDEGLINKKYDANTAGRVVVYKKGNAHYYQVNMHNEDYKAIADTTKSNKYTISKYEKPASGASDASTYDCSSFK